MFENDADEIPESERFPVAEARDEEESAEEVEEPPSAEDLKTSLDVVLFLEHDLGVNVRRLRVKARHGVIHLQGSVASKEQRAEIESTLVGRPNIREVESFLTIEDQE